MYLQLSETNVCNVLLQREVLYCPPVIHEVFHIRACGFDCSKVHFLYRELELVFSLFTRPYIFANRVLLSLINVTARNLITSCKTFYDMINNLTYGIVSYPKYY